MGKDFTTPAKVLCRDFDGPSYFNFARCGDREIKIGIRAGSGANPSIWGKSKKGGACRMFSPFGCDGMKSFDRFFAGLLWG